MVLPLLTPESDGARQTGGGKSLAEVIAALVAANPHQLSRREYHYVARLVGAYGGARFLVFGVGHDSPLWLWVNRGGRTVFLESSARWARTLREWIPGIPICPVRYGTRRSEWRKQLAGDPAALEIALPAIVTETAWDVIFVDAPPGFDDRCAGRVKSIYTAAVLARRSGGADVVVHDCDRQVERASCDRFFGDALLVERFDRTRHYRLAPKDVARAPGRKADGRT